jgi:predicted nucleic acid-binding protein
LIFVDANFFLRALMQPESEQTQPLQQVAAELFRLAELSEIEFTTSDAVLAEVAFILTAKKHYGVPILNAISLLSALLLLPGFRHHNKSTLLHSLEIWESNQRIGFVDALTAAYAQIPGMMLASLDSDFDSLPGIDRWAPGN